MSGWKRWDKSDYHPNFAGRARWRKKHAQYTCEKCGAKQGETRLSKSGRPYQVVVSAAHVNHDPANPRAKLIILCQTCHLEHDVFDHARKAKRTWQQKKYKQQEDAGQMSFNWKIKEHKRKRRKK